jgi:nicotinate phosphoribosyltransferase
MIHYTGTYTDLYELTMAQIYCLNGFKNREAVFDYFFRKRPFEGGYAIFAGLETLLDTLESFTFTRDDCVYYTAQDTLNEGYSLILIKDAVKALDNKNFETI